MKKLYRLYYKDPSDSWEDEEIIFTDDLEEALGCVPIDSKHYHLEEYNFCKKLKLKIVEVEQIVKKKKVVAI